MPGMDGYTVLDQLKKDSSSKTIPVILIIAKAMAAHLRDDSYYGLNLVLSKPFSKQELLEIVGLRVRAADKP